MAYGTWPTGARLPRARPTRARLTRARLTRARLTRARLTRARLTRARLTRARPTRARPTTRTVGRPRYRSRPTSVSSVASGGQAKRTGVYLLVPQPADTWR
ncbi:pentapeptide repeat-containing protein [Streptomyces sp. AC627_RSS907]|uniref:pentapeptide repeat-containing protein n=1 Tax=Streptomyces sp. AC627_RSS907 TaxID=2823684 RepID=UPI001C24FA40